MERTAKRAAFPATPSDPKGYRYCPTIIKSDGSKVQKTLWLGKDRTLAELRRDAVDLAIRKASAQNREVSEADLKDAINSLSVAAAVVPVQQQPPVAAQSVLPQPHLSVLPSSNSDLTLYEGIKLFIASLKHTSIGQEQLDSLSERLKIIQEPKTYTATQIDVAYIPDCRLADINTRSQLEVWRKTYTQRPISNCTKKPISIARAKNLLQALNQCLAWLDTDNRWVGPRHWEGVFAITKDDEWKMMSGEDRRNADNEEPQETYTIEELRILWKLATPLTRRLMLCGLNFGWTQKMIATLRKDYPVYQNGEMLITRSRGNLHTLGFQRFFSGDWAL